MILQIEPWIDEEELEQLKRVITSTYVVEHNLTKEFEQKTKELTGSKYAISITNGTMALFACLKALGIKPGDEVLVPNITFVATANAVIMAGGVPVLCEIDPKTFCMDIESCKKNLSKKTKVIMPVHLYGQAADMEKICSFAKANNLYVLEDAAQGVGVRFNNKHVGTFGELGVLSYYGNKTITCGEGGIVLTDNEELARSVYRLKNHGRDKKGTFIHDHIGYNFSFTEMQAAIGIAQMNKLPRIISKKQMIYDRYMAKLSNVPGLEPVYIDNRCSPVFWFTSFLSELSNELSEFLFKKDILTRKFFYPLNMQPCYQKENLVKNINDDFLLSKSIYNAGISFPSSYSLTEKDQDYVIKCILEFYENRV